MFFRKRGKKKRKEAKKKDRSTEIAKISKRFFIREDQEIIVYSQYKKEDYGNKY